MNESVLICGVVKNVGNRLIHNLNQAIKTGELFKDYHILIYENNSTDNTKEILKKYSNHPKIFVQSENIELTKSNTKLWAYTEITKSDHPCRIESISNARNKLIEEMNKEKYNMFTYVIWIDLDSNGWELDGISESFQKKEEWDVLYSNNKDNYYDMYAYRGETNLLGPEIVGEIFWNNLPNFKIPKSNTLIPVYSAFGGIGIYKKDIFMHHRFDFILNNAVEQCYKNIIKKYNFNDTILNDISKKDKKFPIGIYDEENNIFWKSNSGYNGVVICEHVALNFDLINNGYKIFINPNIIYNRGV